MIKDNNRKAVIIRKAQQQTDHHHHNHPPQHLQTRLASGHHSHHHNHHNHHSHHHHHPHHRLHPHLHQEQRHLHQLHNIHEKHHHHQQQQHQHRRQHGHPRHPHHLASHEWARPRAELLPQQPPHTHQHHHLRLQNNSQYPVQQQQQQRGPDQAGGDNHNCCQPRPDIDSGGFELRTQKLQAQELTELYPASSEEEQDACTETHFTDPNPCHQYRGVLDFTKGDGRRERLLHPHCRHLVKGVIRARSETPPAVHKTSVLRNIAGGSSLTLSSGQGESKPREKRVLRNTLSLPNTCVHATSSSCSRASHTTTATNNNISDDEKSVEIRGTNSHVIVSAAGINHSDNNGNNESENRLIASGTTNQTAGSHNIRSNSNNNSNSATAPSSFPDCACPDMHLPLHTNLPDGCLVTVDAASEHQISQMYALIQAAAMLGEGYGVDEYPTEADFRDEIRGGHTFVVMVRGEGIEEDELEEEEEEDDDEEEEEEEVERVERGEEGCSRGRLIAAFSLATSKFYRGNDVKVADPILIVRREERGKGIGEFLFRHAVLFSRRLGFAGVYTDTFSNNTAMIRIIERSPGFTMVGYLPLGGKMPDGTIVGAKIYFKDLRASSEDAGSSR